MLARLGRTAARVGVGLAAGAVGTAAINLSQAIEMKLTGREASTAPATPSTRSPMLLPRARRASSGCRPPPTGGMEPA